MALTVTFPLADQKEMSWANLRVKLVEVAAAAADYTTGGYQPAGGWAKALGMRQVFGMKVIGGNPLWAAYLPSYDSVNDKLIVMYPTGGGVAPAAVGDPAITAGGVAMTSTAANGSADLTAGRAKEIANATDLSGLGVLRILVFGN